ncbi:MAG TPA: hypothetical protein VLE22_26300 [Bryobacteraceae bacterium]|nr:hypothetical protein [Bryobacteraceae bacterium]
MKLVSLILLTLSAYGAQLMSGGASSNGVWVSYETRLEPDSPSIRKHGGGTLTEKNVIKRHLCNFDNNTYFGYDLVAEPLGGGRYRLRFAPLTITPRKMSEIFSEANVSNWTPLPLPREPATLEIQAGETVALDLFVNPSTGQKVTDYLTIKGDERQVVHVAGPARDFGPEDATIEISFPNVSVDGTPLVSSQGGVSGQAVWIDLPGHGRFVFSLAPHPDLGMQKAGEIRGTTMTWRTGGHEYTITTDKPIASGSRAYNLYVFHIPRTANYFGMSAGAKPDDPIRSR